MYSRSQNTCDQLWFLCEIALYGKILITAFEELLLVLTKFSFCHEELALGYHSMKFRYFPDIS